MTQLKKIHYKRITIRQEIGSFHPASVQCVPDNGGIHCTPLAIKQLFRKN